ncbi:MAG: AI-2E family transporter [Rudaea sp.]
MRRNAWLNVLVVLLVIIAGSYVAQMVWQLLSQFADIILLFVLAWLVAFALAPLIDRINGKPLPLEAIELAGRLFGPRGAQRADQFRYTRTLAVAIVYIGLALALVLSIAALVPPTIVQVDQLAVQFPTLAKNAPDLATQGQRLATDLGIRIDFQPAVTSLLGAIQSVATSVLQNAVVILTGVLSLVGNLLFVLILSFFFALDGPRLFRAIFSVVPESFDTEVRMLSVTVDRAFGGFIRAQLLQALLIGLGTALVTIVFDQPFALVASLFAGLFMLIPFVGAPLALVPPILVALLHDPGQAVFSVGILLIYQVIIVNVIMPKILGDALGLHPLVIIASLLIGIKVGGFWGAFFGVPVAGVIATMALYFYRRWAHEPVVTSPAVAAQRPPAAAPPPVSTASPLEIERQPTPAGPKPGKAE